MDITRRPHTEDLRFVVRIKAQTLSTHVTHFVGKEWRHRGQEVCEDILQAAFSTDRGAMELVIDELQEKFPDARFCVWGVYGMTQEP